MALKALQDRWDDFAASRAGMWTMRLVRWAFFAVVVWYLWREMTRIGWAEILGSLPTQPLFYLLFLGLYVSLPVAEILIYRVTWRIPFWRSLPAFLIKRVYNRDLLGYSGELYFYSWARGRVGVTDGDVARTVRDNNILSSVASTFIAVALLAVFLLFGEVRLGDLPGRDWTTFLVLAGVAAAVLIPLAFRFRRYLFAMSAGVAGTILVIQCARLLVGQVLQIGQWAVVMPEVPLDVWFTFAAVSILITRIPFLPNQNLIFLGAGLEMSAHLDVSTATLAGTLLATNILDKALNVAVLGLLTARAEKLNPKEDPTE